MQVRKAFSQKNHQFGIVLHLPLASTNAQWWLGVRNQASVLLSDLCCRTLLLCVDVGGGGGLHCHYQYHYSIPLVWYGMVWYGMVWYGMVWYGMVWYGMVCCCCCCCEGTQHVPAGEIARHALPGQGAREQSAGVTLAGRVPTTTERGGGGGWGPPWCEGGGGGARARRREEPPVCVTLEPSPAAGGRVTRPVRDRGGVGGLDGGTTCSGTCGAPIPLASGRRSPTTGEGAICLRAPEPHERGRGGALPVSRGACTAQLVRPWCAGVSVGPAQHSWCGPGVRGLLWGLHSTAGAALACGGCCGAGTAQLVRPWRAGVPVGPAQHCWCGPGVRGFLWGLHSTAGAALACGGACGACTAQLVRPWRAGGEGGGGRRSEGVGLGPPPAVGGP